MHDLENKIMFLRFMLLSVICFSLLISCEVYQESNPDQHRTWRDYGGGPDQSKFVKLEDINKSNVNKLEVAWFYPTKDDNVYQFNPVIVDTVIYVLAKDNSLIALDARTGEEIWIHAHLRGIARRGINYWESEDGQDKRLLFQMNDYLQAIDAETGESITSFGNGGLVDLKQGLDRDPNTISRVQSGTPGKIFENLIILGSATGENYLSSPGHLRAFDVRTGENVWTFRTIPHPGEYGYDTWPEEAYKYVGGANTWGEISVDAERGIAYFPVGSPTYDYYGADRIGSNLFGNTLLALDARTGERLWHFQMIHHDLWDYDPAAAPQLITVNHNGEKIDAVTIAGKHGFMFAFDRVTGEPLWPIEERAVPQSHVPGEEAWPTQPYPTTLPPFERQDISPDDITPFFLSDEERTEWKDKVAQLKENDRTGLFVPLSDKYETIAVPGAVGGASWGNTASNPEKGLVYVISINWPSIYPPLEKRSFSNDASQSQNQQSWVTPIAQGQNVYRQYCQACHGEDHRGTGIGTSLIGIEARLNREAFQQVVGSGRGEMPSFSYISQQDISSIYRYLGGSQDGNIVTVPDGPVVATGGIEGSQTYRPTEGGGLLGSDYPEGVDAPDTRYYLDGWGLGHAYIMSPPWSSITAYDLNEGGIKWQRPLGEA